MPLTANDLKKVNLGLGVLSTWAKSREDTMATGVESDALVRNAQARLAQATIEASNERDKGDAAVGDAIAAMASQGSVVDEKILAKIRKKSDYNALSILFNGRMEAADLKFQAGMKRAAAKSRRDHALIGAFSTVLSKWPRAGSTAPKFPELAKGVPTKRPWGM